MPFPSTGCQTCKLRRIKCDGTRPVCRRCVISRRICCGMGADLLVHLENTYASGHLKRPRGPRSVPTDLTPNPTIIRQHLSLDVKTQATIYYWHNHLCTPIDTLSILKRPCDNFLPLRTSIADFPLIDLAIASTALAVFAQTQKCLLAAVESSKQYHKLLQLAQVTISSLDHKNIDACLLAVFLMGRYENAVHRPSRSYSTRPYARALQGFSHHDGSLAILKVWKDSISQHQPATDVIRYTRRSMIKSALLRSLEIPEWMLEGASFEEHGLELEYDSFIIQIAKIRQRLSRLLKERSGQRYAVHMLNLAAEELNKESRILDDALQNWTASFPTAWFYRRHTLANWPGRHFYCPTVYSYLNPAYAAVWIQYFSTRMLLSSTRLKILTFIGLGPDDSQHLESLATLTIMADKLASSLPFYLQRFKVSEDAPHPDLILLNTGDNLNPYVADMAAWPLTIASSLEDVDVKQRSWFRFQLAHFGYTLGDTVLKVDDADQWFRL